VRPGVMFSDMELIGVPCRVVIGEKNLDRGLVEYRGRRDNESQDIARSEIVGFLRTQLLVA
jgi:prolyl-tRNA synthetase